MKSNEKLDQTVEACLRAGDVEGAALRVMQACGPGVLGYLHVSLGENPAQDAFAAFSSAVWQKLRRQRGDQGLCVWAYQLAYRCAKAQRRSARPKRSSAASKETSRPRDFGRTHTATIEPLGVVEDAELMRRELSLEEQTLLTLRLDRQFSWREIAWVLGRGTGRDAEQPIQRRFERLVTRLQRSAVARGLIAPGNVRSKVAPLQLVARSGSRDA